MFPVPANEEERLRILRSYEVVDTPADQVLDDLTALAAGLCDAPLAFVGLMEADRHWFKSRYGTEVTEAPRAITFCAYTVASGRAMVVPDARSDPRFEASPLVTGDAGIRFYAGVPIRGRGGHMLGTICILDTEARTLSEAQLEGLRALGRQAESFFELRMVAREIRAREAELTAYTERLAALQAQRDRLTALVVHDLKNPLASIGLNALFVLKNTACAAEAREAVSDILSVSDRMLRLVNDILDVGRGKSGLTVRAQDVSWPQLTRQLSSLFDCQLTEAGKRLVLLASVSDASVRADTSLLLRILQNLIENALKYSPGRGTITLSIQTSGAGWTQIRVSDEGPGIPSELREKIFEPFVRVGSDTSVRGQGLGLAFCRMAVEAHGGTIVAEPNAPRGTSFLIRLPAPPAPLVDATAPGGRATLKLGTTGSYKIPVAPPAVVRS